LPIYSGSVTHDGERAMCLAIQATKGGRVGKNYLTQREVKVILMRTGKDAALVDKNKLLCTG